MGKSQSISKYAGLSYKDDREVVKVGGYGEIPLEV